MRRGKDDDLWQEVKTKTYVRDRGKCRLLQSSSYKETLFISNLAFQEGKKTLMGALDPAHIYPVSLHPHLIYEELNIVWMNRFSHDLLEFKNSPYTGKKLTEEEYTAIHAKMIGEAEFHKLTYWAQNPDEYKKEKENML
jgi:hypothetical protein